MKNNSFGPGTLVDVLCEDGNIHKGEICNLPMYDSKGDIPRGLIEEVPTGPSPWLGIKKTNYFYNRIIFYIRLLIIFNE